MTTPNTCGFPVNIRARLGLRDDIFASTGARQEPYVYSSLGGTTSALVPAETSLGAEAGAAVDVPGAT